MDDWISRTALNNAIEQEYGGVCVYDVSGTQVISDFQDIVDRQPTIDVAPVVHGRWVKMTGMMPPEYHGHYECSECQWHMKGLRNSWTREEEMTYCPNCGAKMDNEGK